MLNELLNSFSQKQASGHRAARFCNFRLLSSSSSEIVFVDIILREDGRRAEQNLAAVNDLELAKFAGVQFGIARLQLSVDHRAHRVSCCIPQINRVPQDITLHRSALDEWLHLIRSGLTDDRNFANQIGLRDRIGGGWESDT